MEDWPRVDVDEETTPAATDSTSKVNVFDYEVNAFGEDAPHPGQEMQEIQEMQEMQEKWRE